MEFAKFSSDLPRYGRAMGIGGAETIGTDGNKNLDDHMGACRGHPMLIPSAINAVKQWRYRPYLVNDEPAEIETTVRVKFKGE